MLEIQPVNDTRREKNNHKDEINVKFTWHMGDMWYLQQPDFFG